MRLVALLLVSLACPAPSRAWAGAALPLKSDVLKTPRPASGEHFGLYLMGKKVGWLYTNLTEREGQVHSENEIHFKANVGQRTSERVMREVRVYEATPQGRLLSLTVDQRGDGGEQLLEARATPSGLRVLRKRPGLPNETLTVKPSRETVETADQVRVAALRNSRVVGSITDGTDLESYRVTTTVDGAETRTIRGVSVRVTKLTTLSDKEKVPTESWLDEQGRLVEISFGSTMRAHAEPPETAKRLDAVEIFGLTRVVLPRPAPAAASTIPGVMKLVVTGLPAKFRVDNYRQSFKALADDAVEVTLRSVRPKLLRKRPLLDPSGGDNLKSTIIVEADNPEVRAAAKQLAGEEKDAYTVTTRVAQWVHDNLRKDYGSSSDRASDVLKTMKGDCTEHSLLTVAMLRSLGIPARRVDGLVYVMNEDRVPALYWHEWVEAYVGEWTQLDPTFGQTVADATHFAVGQESNAEITPLIGSLKVHSVE
jgi:hypothetical protein